VRERAEEAKKSTRVLESWRNETVNENEFSNVGLYEYGNAKRQRFPSVDEDATCTFQVKYGEISPQKRFVRRATPTH